MEPTTVTTDLDVNQVEEVLTRVEQQMGEETVRPLRLMFTWCLSMHTLLQEKDLSMERLRQMVFGPRTERTKDIFPDEQKKTPEEPNAKSSDSSSATAEITSDKSADDQADATSEPTPPTRRPRRRPAKGHGRIPASAYTGCERVILTHECHGPGDSCPHCQGGTLYRLKDWAMTIRLVGQPPVGGIRYEQERLRCGTCGKIESAKLPDDVGENKYDPSVAAIIAVLRYGEGMPWTRIERIQRWAGIPLPSSVQWELVRDAVTDCYRMLFEQLCLKAAQGELIHNDDTTMRVLELNGKEKAGEPLREDAPERSGVYTTGILSMASERPTIALFFTGPRHSGENLRDLLARRMPDLPEPIQMCDALSHNMPQELKTIVANCLSHGRRKFVELAKVFPDQVKYILHELKKVYRADAAAKRFKLSPQRRLQLHQRRSEPVMTALHDWLTRQLEERKVEPNSSLGNAMKYMLKHWDKLTLFLRREGAPLDNNIAERAMKMAIRHRKNSLYYRSKLGAEVGDIYMSLIYTCQFAKVDPLEYLTVTLKNAAKVKEDPARWLPWNYREQLDPS